MIIRLSGSAAVARRSSYRIHAAAATRVTASVLNLARSRQLSYFAKIVLVFAGAISNI
jgi:hypothetical protein